MLDINWEISLLHHDIFQTKWAPSNPTHPLYWTWAHKPHLTLIVWWTPHTHQSMPNCQPKFRCLRKISIESTDSMKVSRKCLIDRINWWKSKTFFFVLIGWRRDWKRARGTSIFRRSGMRLDMRLSMMSGYEGSGRFRRVRSCRWRSILVRHRKPLTPFSTTPLTSFPSKRSSPQPSSTPPPSEPTPPVTSTNS